MVGGKVYHELFRAGAKWFYYQRASMALAPEHAGRWARAAGHPDTAVHFYPMTDSLDFTLRSPKGWYDAGDYGKYIVNSGITVFTLLQLYEHFPHWVAKQRWNIPESGAQQPDLLSEVRWNLDWMLTMQDADGGVYHKLTTQRFSGSVLPVDDTAPRYVVMKTTPATLNFVATMAQASRVYKKWDPAFAKKCLKAAEKAFAWAQTYPAIAFQQPEGMNTGPYSADGKFIDEFLWAATELRLATGRSSYLQVVDSLSFTAEGPWWGNTNFLAVYRLAQNPQSFGQKKSQVAQDTLLLLANQLRAETDTSAYGVPVQPWNFVWGSHSAIANNGIVLLQAYALTRDASYLKAAQRALDYLLGMNPINMCMVTGFGEQSPRDPHHRPSEGDFIADPVPGQLVGGPHLGKQDVGPEPWKCQDYGVSQRAALSYLDHRCSYATNEVAINWNAPLVYLVGALQALEEGADFQRQ